MNSISANLNIMIKAAEKASKVLIRDFGEVEKLQVSVKGPLDFVTNADKKAEKIIIEELSKSRKKFSILSEETGEIKNSDINNVWIIDPIDGTTNFLHGVPHFAISIALKSNNEIISGLIFDPIKNEMFYAEKNNGTYFNNQRVRVSKKKIIEECLFATGGKKEIKSDNTPVTNGDIEVNNLITNKIKKITPNIKIISEETSANKESENLKDFWLIDPIDGTYDYINDLEEFTINAGLIINNKPAAGLIYAPAKKRMFYSYGLGNAFELTNGQTINLSSKINKNNRPIKFISYSNKIKTEIQKIYQDIGVVENVRMKSSLKFCVVAADEYDGYVAEPRAYEWDIAAGHAILIHSGGSVTDFDGNEILYGKKDLKNPSLILKSKNIL